MANAKRPSANQPSITANKKAKFTTKKPSSFPRMSVHGTESPSSTAEPASSRSSTPDRKVSTLAPEPFKTCRLLLLPGELREGIYHAVLATEPRAYLSAYTKAHLATPSGLIRANRQIHSEFLDVLYKSAPKIVACVKNFNFAPVVTFFNRMSDAELKNLPALKGTTIVGVDTETISTAKRGPKRSLTIELEFDVFTPFYENLLRRWLTRLDHATKRGNNFFASYVVKPESQALKLWRTDLENMLFNGSFRVSERILDEVVKMVHAMWSGFRETHWDVDGREVLGGPLLYWPTVERIDLGTIDLTGDDEKEQEQEQEQDGAAGNEPIEIDSSDDEEEDDGEGDEDDEDGVDDGQADEDAAVGQENAGEYDDLFVGFSDDEVEIVEGTGS